jgi:hypothetical protein
MKRAILIVSCLVISLLMFRFTPVYGVASMAADKLTQVVVTNFPDIFKTREQNLDANGNIKVAEQGTVNVNVTNAEPIAVTGDGSSETPLKPKLVNIFDNRTMSPSENFRSDFIDVEGYKKAVLYLNVPHAMVYGTQLDVAAYFTIDASTEYKGEPNIKTFLEWPDGINTKYASVDVAGSKMYLRLQNNQVDIISAWVYLMP